jgi:hypothetical protein
VINGYNDVTSDALLLIHNTVIAREARPKNVIANAATEERHCERSEATPFPSPTIKAFSVGACFVAALLAMTALLATYMFFNS